METEKKMELGLEAIEKTSKAEKKYLESWKEFHLKKLELDWQKAIQAVVIETAIVEETGKKKYPNTDARKAALVYQFKEKDEAMLEVEFQMKMRLAEWNAEKKRCELYVGLLIINTNADAQIKELKELWEKEYMSKEVLKEEKDG